MPELFRDVPEPYHELPIQARERIVSALSAWARRQPHKRKATLRYIDGSSLSPQDLLNESPEPLLLPETRAREGRGGRGVSRHWAHMLNLVAVSVAHGENLDEILGDLRGRDERIDGDEPIGGGTVPA
jgi:hypothetical protein